MSTPIVRQGPSGPLASPLVEGLQLNCSAGTHIGPDEKLVFSGLPEGTKSYALNAAKNVITFKVRGRYRVLINIRVKASNASTESSSIFGSKNGGAIILASGVQNSDQLANLVQTKFIEFEAGDTFNIYLPAGYTDAYDIKASVDSPVLLIEKMVA